MMQVVRILACVLLVQLATAYPQRWLTRQAADGLACLSHPEIMYASHGAPGAASSGITFTLTDPANTHAAVTAICPTTYNLQVGLFEPANMFLTATVGSLTPTGLANAADAAASTCGVGSRIATNVLTTLYQSWSATLAFSCAQLAGQTQVVLRATESSGMQVSFATNQVTIPVDAACVAAACANGGPPPPPTPSPSPAPPPGPPTVNPDTPPVYPDCINAKLLPNPCPLGKRCFYDKECKPQTEDLVSPNCGNAQPLPNPWASNKCCFYDSQCKPQCEDLPASRACQGTTMPLCSVTGCGWCSNTSADVCERCWTGYVLNLSSGKCDCAPGYQSVLSNGKWTCKKCAAGSISYGGKLGNSSCISCPAGRVANKEQTECIVADSWGHWGGDLTNRRWAYAETTLNVSNIANIDKRWSFTAGGDVTATPVIVDGKLYVPDWNGNMWCLDAVTGMTIWQRSIYDLVMQADPTGIDRFPYVPANKSNSIISRASPAIAGNVMVVPVMKKAGGWPFVLVLNTADGSLVWGKRVEKHAAAMLTMSPTVHAGYIYQGISSLEELAAASASYPCCSFRGSFIKVDLATGAEVWRTWMAPDNNYQPGGFSGNSLWGSSPAVDILRNQVYIATGNNYDIPEALTECLKNVTPITTANYADAIACEQLYGPDNFHNSMLALDLTTGAVRWRKQLGGPDAWNGACGAKGKNPNCAKGDIMDLNSPDYDFAQAPMLVKACNKNGHCKQLVVAGQKSGWLWALNPENGDIHWSASVGPGGTVGGIQWGSAADNSRIYVANNNYLSVATDITSMKPVVNWNATTNQRPPTSTDGGLAAAIDAYTGEILWTFANPLAHWADATGVKRARSQAPMTVANDVVFYSSMDAHGTLFMLDARTGKLLKSLETGATNGCGPSVVKGKVYVGSGYVNFGLGQPGNQLHMLSL